MRNLGRRTARLGGAEAAKRVDRVLFGKLENERLEGINFVEFGLAKYVLARAKVL